MLSACEVIFGQNCNNNGDRASTAPGSPFVSPANDADASDSDGVTFDDLRDREDGTIRQDHLPPWSCPTSGIGLLRSCAFSLFINFDDKYAR